MLKKLTTALLACTVLALPQAFALSVLPEAGVSLASARKNSTPKPKSCRGRRLATNEPTATSTATRTTSMPNTTSSARKSSSSAAGATTSTTKRARRPSTAASASLHPTSWVSSLCDLCQRLAFRRNPGRPQLQHRLRLGIEHQLP